MLFRKISAALAIAALALPQTFVFSAAPTPIEIPNYSAKHQVIGPFGFRDWDARGNYFAWSEFPGDRMHQSAFAGDQKLQYANLATGEVFDITDANQNITEVKLYDSGVVWASKGSEASDVTGIFKYDFALQEIEQIQADETEGALSFQTTPDGKFVIYARGTKDGAGSADQFIVGPDGSRFPLAEFIGDFDMRYDQLIGRIQVPNATFVGNNTLVAVESSPKGATAHVKNLATGDIKNFLLAGDKFVAGTVGLLPVFAEQFAYFTASNDSSSHIFKLDTTNGAVTDTGKAFKTESYRTGYSAGAESLVWKDASGYYMWNVKTNKICPADTIAAWKWGDAPRLVVADDAIFWENGDTAYRAKLQCGAEPAPLPPPPAPAEPPSAKEVPNYSLVRAGARGAVYFIANDRKKYKFPDDKTLKTWFPGKAAIKSIAADKLKLFPDGDLVTYRPATRLIRKKGDSKIFAVDKNGTLRWVRRPSVLGALFGDKWASLVDEMSAVQLGSYRMGATIEAQTDYKRDQILQATRYINLDKDIR